MLTYSKTLISDQYYSFRRTIGNLFRQQVYSIFSTLNLVQNLQNCKYPSQSSSTLSRIRQTFTLYARQACKACLPDEPSIEIMDKFSNFFPHCVEKCLERGEKSLSTIIFFCLYVCLNSDTHNNLRTKSRRKFVLKLKCLDFQCRELITLRSINNTK